jgi:hypothetical protein
MNAFDVRSAIRLHRFEIVAGSVLLSLVSGFAWWVAWQLDLTGYGRFCTDLGTNTPDCAARGAAFFDLQRAATSLARLAVSAVPLLVAPLIGVAVVGRELERGTARLAWSIAPSRTVWVVRRVVPLALVVAGLGLLAGASLDRLFAGIEPWVDPGRSMTDLGGRGVPFAARVLFVFAIALLAGAVAGRTLPALLVTAVIGAVAISGGAIVHERILRTEAIYVDTADGSTDIRSGDLFVDQRIRLPDGRIATYDEAYALYPPPVDGDWVGNGWARVNLVISGSLYPVAAAREAGVLALASLAFLAGAGVVVMRRRPG